MPTTRSRKRTTKWNLFFHYVSISLDMVAGVVLVPIYFKFIPVSLYGAWLATGNILMWLTVIDPGLSTILQQRIGAAYGNGDFSEIGDLIVSGLCITGFIVILIGFAGVLSSGYLVDWINLTEEVDAVILKDAFMLAVAGTCLMVFSYSVISANQGLQGSLGIGMIHAVLSLFKIILTIVLLYRGFGLLAVAIPLVFFGAGLTIMNGVYLTWRLVSEKIDLRFSIRKAPALIRLFSYTFFGRISGLILNHVDLLFTGRFIGPESAALLNLTRKAPDMSQMFVERPAIAFMPAVSHLIGAGEKDKAKTVLLRLLRILLWMLGLFTGGFIAFNDDFVGLWVGRQLFAGYAVNYICVFKFLMAVSISVLANLAFACGNIRGTTLSAFVQSLVYIPAIIVGAKYFGLVGVALAPVVSMLAVQGWYIPRIFSKILHLSPDDRKAIFREFSCVLTIVLPLTLIGGLIKPSDWFQFIGLTTVFGFLYCAALPVLSKACRSEMSVFFQKLATIQSILKSRM